VFWGEITVQFFFGGGFFLMSLTNAEVCYGSL
jgi:hypothetical protein